MCKIAYCGSSVMYVLVPLYVCLILGMWQTRTGTTGFAVVLDELCWLSASKMWINTWRVERRTRVNSHLNRLINNFHLNRVQIGRFSHGRWETNSCASLCPASGSYCGRPIKQYGNPTVNIYCRRGLMAAWFWQNSRVSFRLLKIPHKHNYGQLSLHTYVPKQF